MMDPFLIPHYRPGPPRLPWRELLLVLVASGVIFLLAGSATSFPLLDRLGRASVVGAFALFFAWAADRFAGYTKWVRQNRAALDDAGYWVPVLIVVGALRFLVAVALALILGVAALVWLTLDPVPGSDDPDGAADHVESAVADRVGTRTNLDGPDTWEG